MKRLNYLGVVLFFYGMAESICEVSTAQSKSNVYQSKFGVKSQLPDYEPGYQLKGPYDTYRYSDAVEDFDENVAIERSWEIIHRFASLLDQYVLNDEKGAQGYGLLVRKDLLEPDLKDFPEALKVLARHEQLLTRMRYDLKSESQLFDSGDVYKLTVKAGIS